MFRGIVLIIIVLIVLYKYIVGFEMFRRFQLTSARATPSIVSLYYYEFLCYSNIHGKTFQFWSDKFNSSSNDALS